MISLSKLAAVSCVLLAFSPPARGGQVPPSAAGPAPGGDQTMGTGIPSGGVPSTGGVPATNGGTPSGGVPSTGGVPATNGGTPSGGAQTATNTGGMGGLGGIGNLIGGLSGGGMGGGGGGAHRGGGGGGHHSSGGSHGDPHLRTLDGASFDFMKTGTFTLVQSAAQLKLQAFMSACGKDATCTTGVGIGYRGTVVRFALDINGSITLTKGSSKVGSLSVQQAKGNDNGYRVFFTDEPTSYIDINIAHWKSDAYLDTSCVLSTALKKGMKGLLGNGDGNPDNDSTDVEKLAKAFKVDDSASASLFACKEQEECAKIAGRQESLQDERSNSTTKLDSFATQGYRQVKDTSIPLKPAEVKKPEQKTSENSTKVPSSSKSSSKNLDQGRVTALCKKTIEAIPHCDNFVKLKAHYLTSLCIKDTLLVGDLNNIDHAKLAYLRQCRRMMEIQLTDHQANGKNLGEIGSAASSTSVTQKRSELTFGTNEVCPKDCSQHGKCLLAGCACAKGFTGFACEIVLP